MISINDYNYLWTSEKNDWVLVNSTYGYAIINKKTQSMLLVSDEHLYSALIDRMLLEGNKVFNSITDAYSDV